MTARAPGGALTVRAAARADLPGVSALAAAHAAYERAAPPPADLADRLAPLLFDGPAPRLHVLVVAAQDGTLVGYASCAPELSTWQGRSYLHLDCLFLDERYRGQGLGGRLVTAVAELAGALGLGELQWNTPDWNTDAIRFYRRLGATERAKLRFSLPAPAPIRAG